MLGTCQIGDHRHSLLQLVALQMVIMQRSPQPLLPALPYFIHPPIPNLSRTLQRCVPHPHLQCPRPSLAPHPIQQHLQQYKSPHHKSKWRQFHQFRILKDNWATIFTRRTICSFQNPSRNSPASMYWSADEPARRE